MSRPLQSSSSSSSSNSNSPYPSYDPPQYLEAISASNPLLSQHDDLQNEFADSDNDDSDQDVDGLDYDGIELAELGHNSSSRSSRRRTDNNSEAATLPTDSNSGWKGRFSLSHFRKRLKLRQRWRSWRSSTWVCAALTPDNRAFKWLWKWASCGPAFELYIKLLGLGLFMSLAFIIFFLVIAPSSESLESQQNSQFDMESFRQYIQSEASSDRISENMQHIASYNHLAGTEGSWYMAEWIKTHFQQAELDEVDIEEFQVYLNFPTKEGRRVAITDPPEWQQEFQLDEDTMPNTHVFHGHSRSGTVSGPIMWFNHGTIADYDLVCSRWAINCTGAIAIVKSEPSDLSPGLKVKNAEKWGIKAVLIYSDGPDGPVYPEGRFAPPDAVRQNSVSLNNWVLGDVLTPGWASTAEAKRIDKNNNPGLVSIPSLPISWDTAAIMLSAVKNRGVGPKETWGWWTGDQTSPTVLLRNEQDEVEKSKIYNVLGRLNGVEPDAETIIIGAHRDSWCMGAADGGSGTAVLLEMMRIIGSLKLQGWRPLRNIIFASWDASEYNLIGSTEFVEKRIAGLRESGVAYINVGAGVYGSNFTVSASPLFQALLGRVLNRIGSSTENLTLKEIWEQDGYPIKSLDSNGDYAAFQSMAGVSSIDLSFQGEDFPLHTCYETHEWISNFGDPGFVNHQKLAQIWLLLMLELSQESVLPISLAYYATAMDDALEMLRKRCEDLGAPASVSLDAVGDAILSLFDTSIQRDKWEMWWYTQMFAKGLPETNEIAKARRKHNNQLTEFEANLLDLPGADAGHPEHRPYGMPGREQFKHVIFGPTAEVVSGEKAWISSWYPFIRDAVEGKDWPRAVEMIRTTANIMSRASRILAGPVEM